MPQPEPMGFADRKVVFDLLEDLRAAWETILNDYARQHDLATQRGGVRYVDAQMAVHNFFKLALDNIAREAGLTGQAAAEFYLGAATTFAMAMRARADEMIIGRPAGSGEADV